MIITADDLKRLITYRHPLPEWAVFVEMSRSTGASFQSGYIDVAAFSCWPSKKLTRVAYEVKISRGDFLREIDNPDKRSWVERYFHQTYFVCKHDICKESEIPDGWGLFITTKKGDKIRRVRAARYREEIEENPPYWFMIAALRRSVEEMHRMKTSIYTVGKQEFTVEEFQKYIKEQIVKVRDVLDHDQKVLHREQTRYRELSNKLAAPLLTLQGLAGEVGYRYIGDRVANITSKQVQEWFDQAKTRKLTGVIKQLEEAHESIGTLLDEIKRQEKNVITWTPDFEVTIPLKEDNET